MRICSIEGCGSVHEAKGYCSKHWQRFKKFGDPLFTKIREHGMGSIQDGYVRRGKNLKLDHVRIVEEVLGVTLPKGVVVHHMDCNGLNNEKTNLVVCQDQAYHALLHQRMRAYDACGHAGWRKCQVCKQYDDPDNLKIYKNNAVWHKECNDKRNQEKRIK